MKTVRFTKVVETSGKPETYLAFSEPAKDSTLRAAIKAFKIMTVFRETVGTKADRGKIGFDPGRNRQFLIFPRSLSVFQDKEVVGIKYDLLESEEVSEKQRGVRGRKPPTTGGKQPTKPIAKRTPAKRNRPEQIGTATKVLPFRSPPDDANGEDSEVAVLKKQVCHAMEVLEEGKAVAAFNLLKRIVDE